MQVSATDMAYALSSLLEYPHHVDSIDASDTGKKTAFNDKENVNSRNAQTERVLK